MCVTRQISLVGLLEEYRVSFSDEENPSQLAGERGEMRNEQGRRHGKICSVQPTEIQRRSYPINVF